ncbi:MAG: hypothetical protein QW735_01645 [archaeon]
MGKQKSSKHERMAEIIFKEMRDKITEDFSKNKKLLIELNLGLSKVERNILAGILTNKAKKGETL